MGDWKQYFEMTRRQRFGTIVVLIVIAVLLVMTVVVRSCRIDGVDPVPLSELQQFEAQVDSAAVTTSDSKPVSKPKSRSKRHTKPARKAKPSHQPRRLDPVPEF